MSRALPPPEPRPLSALVLRLRPVGESDIMVDLFSRELGRVTGLAKGGKRSQKRFFGLLLAGHHLEVGLLPGRRDDLWLLQGARLLASHLGLRQDYRRLLHAGPVLELLLRAAAPHDPHPGALDLALMTLARLERAENVHEMASALVIFLARLLGEMGYGLALGSCLHCGRPLEQVAQPRLSLAGGLACQECPPQAQDRQVPPGLVKSLGSALSLGPPALGRLSLSPALLRPGLGYLGDFWRHVSGHDLPSLGLALDLLPPFPSRRKSL
ncbi:MAG: DNA repair protein RecO [Desulfarculus sp.]|nr:DNA repair protein RecO [Desulfarculus sp.]